MSSKPAGSTGRARSPGARAASASAMPEVRPPPPQQTSTSALGDALLRGLFRDFEPGRSLPGDDVRLVIRA